MGFLLAGLVPLLALLLVLLPLTPLAQPALAITAPELRGQRSLQDLEPDMHGRDLKQQEFLKATRGWQADVPMIGTSVDLPKP